MALLATCPAYRCFLLVWGSFAFALVGVTLRSGGCGRGDGGIGRWFISASEAGGVESYPQITSSSCCHMDAVQDQANHLLSHFLSIVSRLFSLLYCFWVLPEV